jgi:hypothetical protein
MIYNFINIKYIYKILNRIMNSLWDIHIFLGLVPKESPCITLLWENLEDISCVGVERV